MGGGVGEWEGWRVGGDPSDDASPQGLISQSVCLSARLGLEVGGWSVEFGLGSGGRGRNQRPYIIETMHSCTLPM